MSKTKTPTKAQQKSVPVPAQMPPTPAQPIRQRARMAGA